MEGAVCNAWNSLMLVIPNGTIREKVSNSYMNRWTSPYSGSYSDVDDWDDDNFDYWQPMLPTHSRTKTNSGFKWQQGKFDGLTKREKTNCAAILIKLGERFGLSSEIYSAMDDVFDDLAFYADVDELIQDCEIEMGGYDITDDEMLEALGIIKVWLAL